MSKKFNKVMVTGADGFIGSHLVESLVRSGYRVKPFVMYNSFNSWGWLDQSPDEIKSEVDVYMGDIRDQGGLRKGMQDCDAVLHLAALIGIPYSYRAPEAYLSTNVQGTLNVMQCARDLGIAHVVHTSTSEVYGTALTVPIDEDHPLQGQSPYSASKIGADQFALSFHRSFDLPVSVIRPFNTYGPRQSARAVIPTIITQIAKGAKVIELGSLSPTRDLNYVQDTVNGFIAALESQKGIGTVLNLGSGFEISIGDLAELISKMMNSNVEIKCSEERMRPKNSEVERLLADAKKAREILGWGPAYEGLKGLEHGLTNTIEWFSNPKNLENYKTGYQV